MLLKLSDFGISSPIYLRKIDRLSHWNPENSFDFENRVNQVADKVFRESVCSIWQINSDEELYGVVAAISSRRNPRHQDIDFIYLTEQDLDEIAIFKKQTEEGKCLFVKRLHYNIDIDIDRQQARKLCRKLLQEKREPQRCKKKMTQEILAYQEKRGCKAVSDSQNVIRCDCEKSSDC